MRDATIIMRNGQQDIGIENIYAYVHVQLKEKLLRYQKSPTMRIELSGSLVVEVVSSTPFLIFNDVSESFGQSPSCVLEYSS